MANGAFVSTRPLADAGGGARVESVWRESQPIPVYLMVIAAAPLDRYDLGETACGLGFDRKCVPQYVYTAPEQAKTMPGPFARAGDIVALFSRLVGPFPYEKLAHLQSSTRYGGMENASEIFYADGAFRRGTMNDELIAHETAHQWFGDAVTERQWPHVWLSEGFATYFSALWVREARGDSAFRTRMRAIRSTVLRDSVSVTRRPVIDTIETTLIQLLNRNSYEKGGFVLHMLREQVGDSAFFRALRAYYAEHRNSTALTADLQAAMEKTSGQKLDWFFDQWLRRPGYPKIDARWRYDRQTHEAVIDVRQAARFGTFRVAAARSASSTRSAASTARCCRFRRTRRCTRFASDRRRCRRPCCSTRTSRSSPPCGSPRPRRSDAHRASARRVRVARRVASRGAVAWRSGSSARGLAPRRGRPGPGRVGVLRRGADAPTRSGRPLRRSAIFSSSAARRGSGATLLEESLQFGGDPVLVGRELARAYLATGEFAPLAALPAASPAQRERAKWLTTHEPRVIAPDSVITREARGRAKTRRRWASSRRA